MERRLLWIYALVVSLALVAAFVQETGLAGDPLGLARVAPRDAAVLLADLALVWIFAGLAVKARLLEPPRETVRRPQTREPRPARRETPTGVFSRPSAGRL